ALRTYAGSATTTLASAPVTVSNGAITSAVTDDMLWTVEESTAAAAYDGQAQYFLKDAAGNYLRRGSGSSGQGAQLLSEALYSTIRYNAWSFYPYEDEDAYAMYANSERAYGTDYPFYVYGNETSFDSPGRAQRDEADPFAFTRNDDCSHITLYVKGEAGPTPIDLAVLEAAIAAAEAIDLSKYTDASVDTLQTALAAAKAARTSDSQATVDSLAAALNRAVQALVLKPTPVDGSYVKANVIEPGMTYVIVADGAYAMTNEEVAGKESYASFSTTRGAKAVTIEDGIITSEVTPDMLWTFEPAEGADPAYDGLDQYFITDSNGKYLRRGSMSQRNGGLTLVDAVTNDVAMRYYTWSFKPFDGMEATYCMYTNSERAYGTDYAGRVGGNASGFDIPSTLDHRSDGDPFNFMNDSGCSKITLYVLLGVEPCEHEYVPVVTAPTCTEKGYTTYTCSKCGRSYKGDETAALGHSYGEWVTTTEATCTAAGEQTRTCSRCGAKETKAIAATGHSFGEWAETKAATCTEAGFTTYTCSRCGDSYKGDEVAKLDHDYVDGVCTRCGEKDPNYVEPVNYDALNAAIADAEKVEKDKYTDESVAAFEAALAAAKEALKADKQADVDKAKADLDAAKAALVEKEPFRFDDVKDPSQYYFDPVYWAVDKGITTGTSATKFSPESGCTRAQVVTFLWRAAGQPEPTSANNPFEDVPADQYYYKAVLWAVEKGITTGTSATTFRPDRTCTRAQIVTFLWRYAGQPEPTTTVNPFEDVPATEYYYKAVLWAVENGITTGTSPTTFRPDQTCTRAQIVTFLYRYMSKQEAAE
ncbi:MAG: S-layer homology domain-containing protein, partial [Oscillospiraceae bacterium]|nr:S-layer homology domain-containing protein [Oscillospiraceae bacterium]